MEDQKDSTKIEVKRGPGRPKKEPTPPAEALWSEIERKAKSVAQAVASGLTDKGYLSDVSEANEWGLDELQRQKLIADAEAAQAEIREKEAEKLDMVRKLDAMIRINFENGDLKEARLCLKEKAGVLGILVSRSSDDKKSGATVVKSRFQKKWDKVSGKNN